MHNADRFGCSIATYEAKVIFTTMNITYGVTIVRCVPTLDAKCMEQSSSVIGKDFCSSVHFHIYAAVQCTMSRHPEKHLC